MKALVFWQNTISIHQAPLIRAVGRQWPSEVLLIAETDLSAHRLRQGWTHPDFSPARLVVVPDRTERRRLVNAYGHAGCVHIFSGFHGFPETYRTLKQVSRTEATIGVYVEPGRHDDGFVAILRRLRYIQQALWWRRRIDLLLTTGELGVQWYRGVGFPQDRIFPFGYFVEELDGDSQSEDQLTVRKVMDSLQLLFVGELVHWKGVDILLHALARDIHFPWQLNVIGDGPKAERYQDLADRLDLSRSVRWLGFHSNSAVRAHMRRMDMLVLPSRYDGWGTVINEALMAGTFVVASNACGASDLLRHSSHGRVFHRESVEDLRKTLNSVMEKGLLSEAERTSIRTWAQSAISPDVVAQYMLQIIKHVQQDAERPNAPWRRNHHLMLVGSAQER